MVLNPSSNAQDIFHPSFLKAVSSGKSEDISSFVTQDSPKIWKFPIFTEAFCMKPGGILLTQRQ